MQHRKVSYLNPFNLNSCSPSLCRISVLLYVSQHPPFLLWSIEVFNLGLSSVILPTQGGCMLCLKLWTSAPLGCRSSLSCSVLNNKGKIKSFQGRKHNVVWSTKKGQIVNFGSVTATIVIILSLWLHRVTKMEITFRYIQFLVLGKTAN